MNARIPVAHLQFAAALIFTGIRVAADEPQAAGKSYQEVQFTQAAPYSTKAEITRRFGYPEPFPDLDIASEKFQLLVPSGYSTNSSTVSESSTNSGWGLLVWVSPGNTLGMPPDWAAELARHRLLVVGAMNAGNERHLVDRFRLALDATCNVCRQYKIDRKRIYIGGMSGGGRVASMLGIACADLFTGTLSVCGVNYYRDITDAAGIIYPASFLPDGRILPLARKSGRFVLLTGEFDPNRENTKATQEKGFQRDGFKNVIFQEVPRMKHAMPNATELAKALDFLDGVEARPVK